MEDDLSLSQTLGGLRIVNPDNESSPTSSTEATLSTTRPTSINTAETDHSSLSQRASPLSLSFLYRGESPTEFSTSKASSSNYDQQFMNQCSNYSSRESLMQNKDQESKSKIEMNRAFRNSVPSDEVTPKDAQLLLQDTSEKNRSIEQFHERLPRPISDNNSGQLSYNPLPAGDSNLSRYGIDPSRLSLLIASSSSCTDSPRSTVSEVESVSKKAIGREQSRSQRNSSYAGNDYGNPRPSFRRAIGAYSEIRPGYINEPTSRYDMEANMAPSSEDWKDKGAAVGIREEYDSSGNLVLRQVKKGVRDFVFGHLLGEGSYSQVVLGTDRQTLKEYAVKVLDKKHIIKEKKVKYVNIEKDTLNRLIEHPGIVRLYYTFQDSASLYYVLDIASGGELLGVLKKVGSFDEECTRFYGAQILDAIDHMHKRGVIHRDLKPENVLMDDKMHVKITDFGTAKLLPDPRKQKDKSGSYDFIDDEDESSRAKSFVGTAEYVSPELLTEKNACKASDLWAFGCIIYQLLTGRPPFKASNDYQTFQKIVNLEYEYPPGFPRQARDLIDRLLVLDPQKRLSIEHIKSHPFFEGTQWGRDLWKQKAPRLKPYIPQPQEPNIIKLSSSYPNIHGNTKNKRGSKISSNGTSRPHPTVITELPPPTQLDIEWSPVLTRNNERILKLGNLNVSTNPISQSSSTRNADHGDNHERKRLSRFFGGNSNKKRQRLVIVTSSARIVLVAAGGEEKKLKTEISLLGSECSWQVQADTKGQEIWCVYNQGTQYTFEDSKNAVATGDAPKSSAQQWIDSIERAKEIATSQSVINSFNNEIGFDVISTMSSPKSARFSGKNYCESININDRSSRSYLKKGLTNLGGDEAENYGKKSRFGKRQSKSGLSIPF